ncbi:MAG: hypothetical protein NTX96_02990 [Candidatus Zambryskibacteria bacterium]|nr:hypothetical protein [Candidatus Zambryskibacteria bacterium]
MEDNVKTHIKENEFLYTTIILAVLIIVLIIFGYKKGYRFQENFMIGKLGSLSLVIAMPQTNIFIDENKKIVTSQENEIVKFSLSPREHTIIISRDGYFPWKKDFLMQSEGNINFSPVFVSSNPSGSIITKNDPEFWKIRNKIIIDPLPTKNTPRISKDGLVKLWIDGNAVKVEIASNMGSTTPPQIKTVIQPDSAIRNLYFYKDRSDVIVFSINNSIYAIEVDKEGTQNFLPIYKGTAPSFIEGDSNYIYVLDGETLMQVII